MPHIELTFLGTGNYLAPADRYWNSFVVRSPEATVLVEPSPSALPRLRQAGFSSDELDAVVVSHFHPDHSFGWPFLVLDLLMTAERRGATRPLSVIGPPKVRGYLDEMMSLGSVGNLSRQLEGAIEMVFVEASTVRERQSAGPLAFTAIEVEHVAELQCFGFVFEMGGVRLGYSGDTKVCPGLDAIVEGADAVVVECNGAHPHKSHMDVADVRELRRRHPRPHLIATHMGSDVLQSELPGVHVPADFEVIVLGDGGKPTA